jgi:hypothetical protein
VTRRFLAIALLCTAAVFLAGCGSSGGTAHRAPPTTRANAPNKPVGAVSVWSIPHKTPAEVAAYWTSGRMANAKPYPAPVARKGAAGALVPANEQAPVSDVAPVRTRTSRAARAGAMVRPASGSYPRKRGYPYKLWLYDPPTDLPAVTEGKIFFTEHGKDWVCSGTVVHSQNESVVWTAGHCAFEGGKNRAHTNWVFVPGYRGGGGCMERNSGNRCTYGQWTPRDGTYMWSLEAWLKHANDRYDLAAVVVQTRDGTTLEQAVGAGQGIRFNGPAANTWYFAFGYPEARPFRGSRLFACEAKLGGYDRPEGEGPATLGIGCPMTGGSSGGGWLADVNDEGLGYVYSVNSYGYDDDPAVMYGPYQAQGARNLYDAVSTLG